MNPQKTITNEYERLEWAEKELEYERQKQKENFMRHFIPTYNLTVDELDEIRPAGEGFYE